MKPVIVFGFGRCGSSALMRALEAMWVEPAGNAAAPDYEDEDMPIVPGKATKMLDITKFPDVFKPIPGGASAIVLKRKDARAQGRSALRFMATQGVEIADPDNTAEFEELAAVLAGSMQKDFPTLVRRAKKLCGRDPLVIAYEDLRNHPLQAMNLIGGYIGLPNDAMREGREQNGANVIIPFGDEIPAEWLPEGTVEA